MTVARTTSRVALALLVCVPVAMSATAPAVAFPNVQAAAVAAVSVVAGPARLTQLDGPVVTPWPRPDRPEDLGPVPRAWAAPAPPAPPSPSSLPVLYLHGALLGPGCVGSDVTGPMAGLATVLRRHKWTGPVRALDYYCGDTGHGAVDIRGSARPTADTSITDIARLLAGYVYRTYSSRGVAVDLVGHSMGGLIIRDALAHAGQPGFPPYLLVRAAVSISTPYAGFPSRAVCPVQCQQMAYGSDYLANVAPQPPQGRGGTAWTEIGGSPCDNIPGGSTLALGSSLRVDLGGRTPVCYSHVSYLGDTSSARDLPATVTSPAGRVSHVTGPRALDWVYQGLLR